MSKVFVINSTQPEAVLEFFTQLGLSFAEEQHGNGPVHHACEANGMVFEIYPARKNERMRFLP